MRKQAAESIIKLFSSYDDTVLILCDVDWGFDEIKTKYPDRYYDLGLREQTAVSVAAGLAQQGLVPVVVGITPFFLERAFEQIKIDVVEDSRRVIFVGYEYGKKHGITHQCLDAEAMLNVLGMKYEKYPCLDFVYNTRKEPFFILLKDEIH